MPFLKCPDYAIHYTLDGPADGPLLMLSNSLGADLGMWESQAAEFAQRFRVVRYDNRGHGESTAPAGSYTIAQLAGDALALLDELHVEKTHFCGLSLGGMVGMWLATHKPERLNSLVLCNTAAWLGPADNWDLRIAAVNQGGMGAISKTVMERWFTEGFRHSSAQTVAKVESSFLRVSVPGYVGCCGAIRDMDQRNAVAQIKAPTMVVAGTHDPATLPAAGLAIAEAVAGCRYVELPTAHLSNIEKPAMFNDAVGHFLSA